jgi:hypothetical protein
MRNIALKKFVVASIVTAVVCVASTFTAKAALEPIVNEAAQVDTAPATPAAPASDFSSTSTSASAAPAVVVSNPAVVVPEPGTMFAGLGVLTYFLLKSGRRTRA